LLLGRYDGRKLAQASQSLLGGRNVVDGRDRLRNGGVTGCPPEDEIPANAIGQIFTRRFSRSLKLIAALQRCPESAATQGAAAIRRVRQRASP
jgi:hypothetical protein